MPDTLKKIKMGPNTVDNVADPWLQEGSVLDDFYMFSVYLLDQYNNKIFDQNACRDNNNLNIGISHTNPRGTGYYYCYAPILRSDTNVTL